MQFNPSARISVHFIGPENTADAKAPLLIIDDCLLMPHALVEAAKTAQFSNNDGDFYPGIRAPLPPQYCHTMAQALTPLLAPYRDFNSASLDYSFSAFSLTTQASQTLKPIQCIPHYDDTHTSKFALVHYLFQQDLGGTGFFQHKKTGYWQINPQNQNHYMKTLGTQATTEGLPEAAYIQGSTPLFEEYFRVTPMFNRAIVYPCNLLHSGLINAQTGLSPTPNEGRLTANLALEAG